MGPSYVYIFDSTTANEAATAVREGQCGSIIQYHTLKHQERENKLRRLGQLANLTTNLYQQQPSQAPPPPQPPQPAQPPQPTQPSQEPPAQSAPPASSAPSSTQAQQQQPQQQQPPSQNASQPQQLDPLSSMAAMSDRVTLDNYGHTVHHHPPS